MKDMTSIVFVVSLLYAVFLTFLAWWWFMYYPQEKLRNKQSMRYGLRMGDAVDKSQHGLAIRVHIGHGQFSYLVASDHGTKVWIHVYKFRNGCIEKRLDVRKAYPQEYEGFLDWTPL